MTEDVTDCFGQRLDSGDFILVISDRKFKIGRISYVSTWGSTIDYSILHDDADIDYVQKHIEKGNSFLWTGRKGRTSSKANTKNRVILLHKYKDNIKRK